jgi:hypothetical protein
LARLHAALDTAAAIEAHLAADDRGDGAGHGGSLRGPKLGGGAPRVTHWIVHIHAVVTHAALAVAAAKDDEPLVDDRHRVSSACGGRRAGGGDPRRPLERVCVERVHGRVRAVCRAAAPHVEIRSDSSHGVALAGRGTAAEEGRARPARVGRRVDPQIVEEAAVRAAAHDPQVVMQRNRRVLVSRRRLETSNARSAPRETRRMKDDEIVHEDSSGIAAKKVDVTTEGVGGAARTRRGLAGGGDGSPGLPLNRVRRHRRRAPRARPGRIATAKEEGLKPRHVQEAHDAVERRGGRPGGVEDGSPHHIVLAHPLVQLDQGEGGIGPIAAQLRHER